jgi:hypothetical protein
MHQESSVFDPFMFLSLPIINITTRDLFVYLVKVDPSQNIMKLKLSVPKNSNILDLKKEVQRFTGFDPSVV